MISRPRWMVGAAVIAAVVELFGFYGWWKWRQVSWQLLENPAVGAAILAREPWVRLPSVVWRSRRLPARELGKAANDAVIPALRNLSRAQLSWLPVDPSGYVNRARAEFIEGSVDRGLADLEAAIIRSRTSPEIYRLMALGERSRGRSADALNHLATCEGLGLRDQRWPFELTPHESDWVRIEGLERRLDYYPRERSRGVIALSQELRKRGQTDLGRQYLEEESSDPRVVLELARWELDDGSPDDARRRLAELANRAGLPSSLLAETWAVTAMVCDRQGDSDAAIEAANRAVAYDPRSASPYRVLAALAERRGDFDEALDHMRRAWGMNPTDVNLLMAVARIAEKAGQYDDARLALERAWTADPANPGLAAALVDFYLRRGEFMNATLTLSDALDRFPTDPRLLGLADRLRAEVRRR